MSAFLLSLFFLSGAAALLSGMVYVRKLMIVLCGTPPSAALILAVLLLGISLGSVLASRWDRKPICLLGRFARLELGLGIYGLAFPLLGILLSAAFPFLARSIEPHIAGALLSGAALGVPALLQGAVLPVMHGLYIRGRLPPPAEAGSIGAALAFGAAAGAAFSGYLHAGRLGLTSAGVVAALIHGAVFLAALWIRRRRPDLGQAFRGPLPGEREHGSTFKAPFSLAEEARASVVFAAVFCNAFACLVLQSLWLRVLVFFLGEHPSSLSAVLFTYRASLGVGAAVFGLLGRRFALHLTVGAVILVLGGVLACCGLYLLPHLYGILESMLGDSGEFGIWPSIRAGLLGSLLVMFPGLFLLGMVIPLAVGIQIRERLSTVKEAGLVFAVATLGASLGVLAAGWLIVPAFHVKMGIVISGFMVIAAGILVFLFARLRERVKTVAFLAGITAIWLFVRLLGGGGNLGRDLIFDSHVFNNSDPPSHVVVERNGIQEGNVCTATVVRDVDVRERRLYLNALHAASTGPASSYLRMMAHLPVLSCPEPERALLIGYGIGAVAGALSLHPDLEAIEITEVSREVMAAAPLFSSVNRLAGIEEKPEGTAAVETYPGRTGRLHLLLSKERFDLIIVAPSMPFPGAGVRDNTAEFLALCLERLNPSGVLGHCIPLNRLPVAEVKRLLKTFVDAMPGSACFLFEENLLLLGFPSRGWRLPLPRLAKLFAHPAVGGDLEIAGFLSPLSLAGAYIADGETLSALLAGEKALHDDGAYLRGSANDPGRSPLLRKADNLSFLLAAAKPFADRLDPGAEQGEAGAELYEQLRRHELSGRKYYQGLEREARARAAAEKGEEGLPGEWSLLYEQAFYLNPDDRRAARKYAQGLIREALLDIDRGDFTRAHDLTRKAAAIAPEVWEVYMAFGVLYLAAGDFSALAGIVEILHQMQPYSNLTIALRAELARESGDEDRAKYCESLLEESGGLSGEERRLLEKAGAAREAGEARFAVQTVELVKELLCMGPEGRIESGRRAWTLVEAVDPALLEQAKEELLALLEAEGREERMAALQGLAFFNDPMISEKLEALYRTAAGPEREAVLEALVRTGDTRLLLEVLQSPQEPVPLLVKALSLVCEIDLADAAVLSALIELLESEETALRFGAFVALVHLTDLNFDFDPNGPETERKRSIDAWRRWFKIRKDFEGR